jgi:hypothetical protein
VPTRIDSAMVLLYYINGDLNAIKRTLFVFYYIITG